VEHFETTAARNKLVLFLDYPSMKQEEMSKVVYWMQMELTFQHSKFDSK
jgi:hypothetical protein